MKTFFLRAKALPHRNSARAPLLLLAGWLAFTAPSARAIAWKILNADASPNIVGPHASLAIAPNGLPAISYIDATTNELKYAAFDGATWTIQTIGNGGNAVGEKTSLAFAPATGRPAIAYYDAAAGDLKFASFNGSVWSVEAVDTSGNVGAYASLAFTPASRPAIAYQDVTNLNLKFAAFDGATWTTTTVDPSMGNVGSFASLAFDPLTGQPAIAYYDLSNVDLRFAEFNGATWSLEPIDTVGAVGQHASLAFAANGRAGIAYRDTNGGDLKYAQRDGDWSLDTVDTDGTSVGLYASLAFDSGGHPAIAHYSATNQDLKFTRFDGTTWASEKVDDADQVGFYASFAFLPGDEPAIAYYDLTNGNLKFAASVVPQPVASPTPQIAAPQVKITGKKKILTTKARLRVKGTAIGKVSRITLKNGKKTVKVTGATSWSAKVKLHKGRNKLTATATGPGGTSAPARATITRR